MLLGFALLTMLSSWSQVLSEAITDASLKKTHFHNIDAWSTEMFHFSEKLNLFYRNYVNE